MTLKNRRLIVDNNQVNLVTDDFSGSPEHGFKVIKIAASGLNRADLLQAKGLYEIEESGGIGLELSGHTVNTGKPLCALVTTNAHSDYIKVDSRLVFPAPRGIDLITAAGLPEALITCWLNLFELGKLKSGESVLIHGGSSGIGSIAIQIARGFGAKVYTTVGSDEKKQACLDLGAHEVFNYKNDDYVSGIKSLGGCDLVLDILGGDEFNKNISVLNKYGRLVMIAVMTGAKAEINLGALLMKNISVIGSTLRSKTVDEKAYLINEVVKHLYPLLEDGRIKPVIDSVYDFEDYAKAYDRLASRAHFGKIVLKR